MQNKNEKSLFGVDLNEYTKNPDFSILKNNSSFIYLRASGSGSGKFRVDLKFLDFVKECRENGIKTGGYHYGIPSYNLMTADSQCDNFINTLQSAYGKKNYGDLMPVLDIEEPTNPLMNTDVLLKWIDRFRTRFQSKTRRRLMLYVSTNFVQENNDFKSSTGTYLLDNMPVWIAMYTSIPGNPKIPQDVGGWKQWRVWQFTDKYKIDGVDNSVDANWGPNNLELLMQPAQVKNFKGKIVGNMINLTWTKNSEIDLLGYNIFVDNYWMGTVDKPGNSFNIPILKLYKPYGRNVVISIEAFDIDGDTSQVRSKFNLTL